MPLLKTILNKIKNMEIERIENENGTAIKFPDGTMIQWGNKSFTGSVSGNTGSYTTVTFPQPFSDNKISISYTPIYSGSYAQGITLYVILTGSIKYGEGSRFTGDTVYRRLSHTTDTTELSELFATDLSFNWHAIGRWK